MKPRHAAALALVGWYLVMPIPCMAESANPSKFSTYRNEAYGLSFRYSNDLVLKEGESKLSWGYLGPVESDLPHGVMVAAVVVPYVPDIPGHYALFLKVSVDTSSRKHDCDDSTATRVKIGSNQFSETEDADLGLCHQRSAEYYRLFRSQACYEFEIGEITHCDMTEDEEHKYSEALKELKKVLATVRIHPVKFSHSAPK
jgi:hypothetical protein